MEIESKSNMFIFILLLKCIIHSGCERPKIIEALQGYEIIDIACGGAHSAAITSSGQLFTWGKGRYGRLGHGDSEDQLKPKLVCCRKCLLNFKMNSFLYILGGSITGLSCYRCSLWFWGCSNSMYY